MSHSESSSDAGPLPTLTPESDTSAGSGIFYGWVMLPIAMAGVIASSPAQTYGIALFTDNFRESLGLSESQVTGAYMLGTLLAALPLRFIGAAMDRYGIRRTKTAVIIVFGLVCILTGLVNSLFTLFLAFFALRMLGQGALGGLLSGSTLAFWFEKRLGTVEGLRNLGVAGAIAVVPGLNLWLIHTVGWRWAYVVLGLIVWAMMLPLMLLFRNRPEDIGQHRDGKPPHSASIQDDLFATDEDSDDSGDDGGDASEANANGAHGGEAEPERDFTPAEARRTRAFWLALLPFGAWAMTNTGVTFSAIPIFMERGVSEADVPILFTAFALGFAVMIVTGGYLADHMRLSVLLALGTACMTASWLLVRLMGVWTAPGLIYPCGLLMGLTQGVLVSSVVPLWPRYFGRKHLGKLKSTLVTSMIAASASGPFLMGVTRDLTGSYDAALTLFIVLCAPLAVGALWATPPAHPPRGRMAG